ncbi:hypothetical protein KGR20_24350 [Cytobacillus oceanisediminis]|nr:hypothetical protein [Cytobacillus oceanisediminis]MBZ9537262.1 hypothetical protein [Cytobacillus oceanisediminis]
MKSNRIKRIPIQRMEGKEKRAGQGSDGASTGAYTVREEQSEEADEEM